MAEIHSTACVDSAAEIDVDASVGPFCVIGPNVRIGAGCRIGPHVTIYPYTTLGPRCRVHAGAVLGDTPQDLAFGGGKSYVDIGADTTIREGVTVHRGTEEGTSTRVGDACFLMAFSHLAHNVELAPRVILANGALLAGYVRVGEGAFISGHVVIHQFVRIGRLTMMGGGAAASKDVPPFMMVPPLTLNTVSGLNVVGLRRAGVDVEGRRQIKSAYNLLYRSGKNVSQAVAAMREQFTQGPALEICDFIDASERGISGTGD